MNLGPFLTQTLDLKGFNQWIKILCDVFIEGFNRNYELFGHSKNQQKGSYWEHAKEYFLTPWKKPFYVLNENAKKVGLNLQGTVRT